MTPTPRLVPDRPSDAALALPDDVEDALVEVIAEEFHNWYDGGNLNGAISSAIRKHLKDIADAFARELDAALQAAALPAVSEREFASLMREAADVLSGVVDSGVPLPNCWRWPLIDELSGAAAMLAAAPAQEAT